MIRKQKPFSNFFEEALDKLDIRECNSILDTAGYSNPVEIPIKNMKTIQVLLILLKGLVLNRALNLQKCIWRLKKKSQISILLRQIAYQSNYSRKHPISAALCFRKYGMVKY